MRRLGFTKGQLVGLATGLPLLADGVRGVLVDARRTHPGELARWLVGVWALFRRRTGSQAPDA